VTFLINENGKWHKLMDDLNGLKKEYLDLANKVLGQLPTFHDVEVGRH
jgi:hypothetical protein